MMQKTVRTSSRRKAGAGGEAYAAMLLAKDGYSIMCRNYTCPGGEVDIIATKDSNICFIEVKMRSLSSGEDAKAAVDNIKLQRISSSIKHFFEEYKDNKYACSLTPRVDIIELYTAKGMVKRHNHIKGVEIR